jgi:metallo-beta-lactamase family protein
MRKSKAITSKMIQYRGYGGIDGEVAGSKHLFTINNSGIEKILHDCGSSMEEESGMGKKLPFNCHDLSAVVISHGHFDHWGEIYNVHLGGYGGKYFAQEVTAEIIDMQIGETINQEFRRINEYNQKIKGKKDKSGKFIPFRRQVFFRTDANEIIQNIEKIKYGESFQVSKNVRATFLDAGHIIGSAQVLYEINDNRKIKILTCVDLGRSDIDSPIVKAPCRDFPEDIDYCFIESTYGNKKHADKEQSRQELEETLIRGIGEKKRMLIGAFSVMRTHAILSDFYWIYKRGNLPRDFKIYLDSPGAIKIDDIIANHPEIMDEQSKIDFSGPENPFNFPNLVVVKDRKLSFDLDEKKGPYAIIAASGMWFMGRIVRHTQSHIEDTNALLMVTGYQIPGKLGALIEEGRDKHHFVNIEGKRYRYLAESIRLRSYGAHADGDDAFNHVTQFVKPKKGIFVVHGEREQEENMQRRFQDAGFTAEIVRKNKDYVLD